MATLIAVALLFLLPSTQTLVFTLRQMCALTRAVLIVQVSSSLPLSCLCCKPLARELRSLYEVQVALERWVEGMEDSRRDCCLLGTGVCWPFPPHSSHSSSGMLFPLIPMKRRASSQGPGYTPHPAVLCIFIFQSALPDLGDARLLEGSPHSSCLITATALKPAWALLWLPPPTPLCPRP